MSSLATAINAQICVSRATRKNKGRTRSMAPTTAAVRHLHYGRIALDAADAPLEFSTGTHETGLIALNGNATIPLGAQPYPLRRHHAIHIPRHPPVDPPPRHARCDPAHGSAPGPRDHPVPYVPLPP